MLFLSLLPLKYFGLCSRFNSAVFTLEDVTTFLVCLNPQSFSHAKGKEYSFRLHPLPPKHQRCGATPLALSHTLEFCISMSAGPPCPQSPKAELHPDYSRKSFASRSQMQHFVSLCSAYLLPQCYSEIYIFILTLSF